MEIKLGLDHGKGHITSAVKIFGIDHEDISENRYEYWIHDCLMGEGIKIGKDSYYGKRLKALIDCKQTKKRDFDKLFNSIVLKYMAGNPELFLSNLENFKNEHYERGRHAKRMEILNVLGF